jgi:RNA polymerase sigma-70 factor (ECF subfamily)
MKTNEEHEDKRAGMDGVMEVRARDATAAEAEAAAQLCDFSELVARQGRFLYRVALGLLRNPQDAEDAVQEAFLKLYRTEAWHGMENERAFLARTVWRLGLDRIAARPARMEDVTEMELAGNEASPEAAAMDVAERALLRRLIEKLPEDLRRTLLLSAIEGMTSREVAEIMAIPEGTVRTRLMRARTELKRQYERLSRSKEVR